MGSVSPAQRNGYVTVEYAIVTAAVIVSILVPIPGIGTSALDLVISAITSFQAHTTTMLAMP